MSITRWDPWGDIVSLREAMNNLLEESFVRPQPGTPGPGMASSLALDVKETPDTFMVTASVPGVPPSDIDITILGDTLRIRGQRKEEIEETGEGNRWLLRERRFGAFERTVSLPSVVNTEGSSADSKDGVLTITLPKADVAKPRSIPIKGAASSGTRRPEERAIDRGRDSHVRLSIGSGQTLGTATPHRAARDKTQVRSRKPLQRRRCECPAASPPGPLILACHRHPRAAMCTDTAPSRWKS